MAAAASSRSVLSKAVSGPAASPAGRTSTQRMGTAVPAEYHTAVPVATSTVFACPRASAGSGSACQTVAASAANRARPGRRVPLTRGWPNWPAWRAGAGA